MAGGRVTSRTGTAPDRYVYYPGSEEIGGDEIRIVAGGTGMPTARRSQTATSFVVELGNGDKFIFDIGSGSMQNIQSLMIPSDFLSKVFLTHLHTDHWGDLGSLWAGGWTAGRTSPLKVWGPSGAREDMGTAYAVEHMLKAYNWDYMTRAVTINPVPGEIEVTEFDYRAVNEVVYQENGVTIRSFPAIHSLADGCVRPAGPAPACVRLQQNPGVCQLSGRPLPGRNQRTQRPTLLVGQRHHISLLHLRPPCLGIR
ncbi:MAG: MBL fold metallo-hydrolase [Gaiellales bacterium]